MSNGGPKQKTSSAFHFAAGLGSGIASAVLLQPADLLKTRVQQSQHLLSSSSSSSSPLSSPPPSALTHALRAVLNGPNPIRTLWRGTSASLIRTGLGSALYFGMLNQMRQSVASLSPPPLPSSTSRGQQQGHGSGRETAGDGGSVVSGSALPKLSNVANLSTGALARVAAGFVLNPVTVLKVRFESTHYAYKTLGGAARDVVAKEGLRGFFAGFGATAVRDAPYAGLYVVMYEQAKVRLGKGGEGGGGAMTVNFVSGVIAAVSATAMTNPFDAIKTRLQIDPGKYRNLVQTARVMLREEGVRSMFSGLSLRVGRKALSSALTWTVYEELIRRAERALV